MSCSRRPKKSALREQPWWGRHQQESPPRTLARKGIDIGPPASAGAACRGPGQRALLGFALPVRWRCNKSSFQLFYSRYIPGFRLYIGTASTALGNNKPQPSAAQALVSHPQAAADYNSSLREAGTRQHLNFSPSPPPRPRKNSHEPDAGDQKTAPVAEVVQSQPSAYDQAVTATVVHAQPMAPPMVVTRPPGYCGTAMRLWTRRRARRCR